MIRLKSSTFLKVVYFSLIIFILETVFFHVLNYIHDYFNAILIISYTVLGVGLGAFVSYKIKISERYLFIFCSLGTIFSLYLIAIKTIFFPSIGISNFIFLFCFFFPAIYISRIYVDRKIGHIYLFDMMGGFLGVVFVFLMYVFLFSESIFFLILLIMPLINLIDISFQKLKYEKVFIALFLFFLILGSNLFYNQVLFDKYNIFHLINCEGVEKSPEGTEKIFCRDANKIKTYDNLVGRIDVTSSRVYENRYIVSYDGWPNDMFNDATYLDYRSYQAGKEWPVMDIRFLYGNVKEPRVLIIGSSATGIIKSIRRITPLENISAVEINPAIIRMMKEDFFEESGRAYNNLNPVLGNGISFAKSVKERFDMITLMNTHSYRNLSHQGAPDYLHTKETYSLLFNILTENGYLMFEERPESSQSRLSLYRQINTLWHALKQQGAENPSDHFIVWTWRGGGGSRPHDKYSLNYYVSILVTKNPINKEDMTLWIDGLLEKNTGARYKWIELEYFEDYDEAIISNEFIELFKMIESNDFTLLEEENFDSSIVTNDRPFLTQATLKNPKLNKLLRDIGMLALMLWILFTIPLIKSRKRKLNMTMNLYHILVAFAFFFIQIVLFQVYQNVFLSPSLSFVLVLGFLLLFSGVGGYFSDKLKLKTIVIFLIPVSLAATILPGQSFFFRMPSFLVSAIGLVLVSITGFLMGFYFPKGLNLIKKNGLGDKVYHFYAIDAAVSCFAVPFALYLGIKVGYLFVIILAIVCYLLATLIFKKCELYAK